MLMSWTSRLYGAGSGWHLLRGVCHHYRQRSFSGLHSPGRSNYTITWNKACSLAGTRRYECQVHGIHKYSKEISVVYSGCSACHHCIGLIRFLITGMWKCIGFESFHAVFGFDRIFFRFFGSWWFFFYGFAVSNKPQCPPPFQSFFWSSLYFLFLLLFARYSTFYLCLFLFSFAFLSPYSAYFSVLSNFHPRFSRLALRLLLLAFFGRSFSFFPAYFTQNPFSTDLNYNNFLRLTKL